MREIEYNIYVIMMSNGIYNIIIFSHGHYFIQPQEKVGEIWVYETRFQNIFNFSCNIQLLAKMIFTVVFFYMHSQVKDVFGLDTLIAAYVS